MARDIVVDLPLPKTPSEVAATLRSYNITQVINASHPPREHVMAPWLPTKGLAMLYAQRGVGKTHVALWLAYAIASGSPFLSWQAPRPRRVLYLDGEMPAQAMQERLIHIVNACDKEPLSPDYFTLWPAMPRNSACRIWQNEKGRPPLPT